MEVQTMPQKLNEAQLTLLKLFSRKMSPDAMKELNRMLVDFYDNLVQFEIEKLQATKSITQSDLDRLQQTHPKRKPYPS